MSFIFVHPAKLRKLWMKIPRRTAVALAVALGVVAVATFTGMAFLRARRALHGAEQTVASETSLKVVSHSYVQPVDTGFEWVSAPAIFSEAAQFNGHLYLAGPTGLFEYDERGHALRQFHVGRELPSSPLKRIVQATLADSRQRELLIATADAGVLAFDGSRFRQIVPEVREARSITAILPLASGDFLIGTSKCGVLIYDGHRLTPVHAVLADIDVTDLAGTESDLWIGTPTRGVAHWHGGVADWFNDTNGLPDLHVYAIKVSGDHVYVGTANGIAEFEDGHVIRNLAEDTFVRSLLAEDNRLLAGSMDDGILEIPLTHGPRAKGRAASIGDVPDVEQLFRSGDSNYAVSSAGLFKQVGPGNWKTVLEPESGLLTDRNISALAMDAGGRLWVGYFDRGLDIVEGAEPGQVQHTRHLEDDHLFCVNRIVPNAQHDATAVATANGLVLFDAQGIRRQVLGRADGLIADHVTDVAHYGDGMAVATPAGLTFIDSGGLRSIYAFHGLVNNHVYALAANGRHLLAGTLGGASLLDDDQVRVSYTTATSTLKHNWITAAARVGSEWWVGTYGGGVMHVGDENSGRFEPASGASADLIVNPDAMLATDHLILAGTMGRGLYVMDRNSERWTAVTDGLPSLNVTAFAAANGYVYVGTDNGLVRIPEQRLMR